MSELLSCVGCGVCRWSVYFGIKVVFYVVVIMGGLLLSRIVTFRRSRTIPSVSTHSGSAIIFSVVMSVGANLIVEMGTLLGFGTLKNLLTGRYVQPKREQTRLPADRHEGFDRPGRAAGTRCASTSC